MAKINNKHIADAVAQVERLSIKEKERMIDEVYQQQPHILASILVQQQLGSKLEHIDVLLQILMVIWQAVKFSGHQIAFISENEQDKHHKRLLGHIQFWQPLPEYLEDNALNDYINNHPEKNLYAYVNSAVMEAGFLQLTEEHGKYLMDK